MLDLADCFDEEGNEKPDYKHNDLSGRPVPKGVRVILDSGIEVPCEVKYDGHSETDKRFRRYTFSAEVNWAQHHIEAILVDEYPMDVHLIAKFPDTLTSEVMAEQARWMASVKTYVGKQV
jgi:hypothetical protein